MRVPDQATKPRQTAGPLRFAVATATATAIATAIAMAMAGAPGAQAHHSISGYDAKRSVQLQGTLHRAKVANPHTWFEISVPGAGGAVTWTVETGGKAYVLRAIGGVLHEQFDPGQSVTVTVHPRRDGSPNGLLMQMRFGDGRVLEGIALP